MSEERQVDLGGYPFRLPSWFAEPQVHATDAYAILKTAASRDITFDIYVTPGAGDKGVDGYFGAVLRRYEDGKPRGFELTHMGQEFRGWYIDQSAVLSTNPGSFFQTYGTVSYGDGVCMSWRGSAPRRKTATGRLSS